jgi:hypothetical protein
MYGEDKIVAQVRVGDVQIVAGLLLQVCHPQSHKIPPAENRSDVELRPSRDEGLGWAHKVRDACCSRAYVALIYYAVLTGFTSVRSIKVN